MRPPSQKHRRIGFHLASPGGEPNARFDFLIRPEEVSIGEPSRLSVNETLGGAWADVFDRGVATITLSGHNGWRGGLLASGEDLFRQLRATCYLGWHERRARAVASGRNPDGVRLTYVDTLNGWDAVVAPRSFDLRRNRASPLLMKYQIVLLVLDDAAGGTTLLDKIVSALSNPLRWVAGLTGLEGVAGEIQAVIPQVRAVAGLLSNPIGAFGQLALDGIALVRDVAREGRGVFDNGSGAVLETVQAVTHAGANAMAAIAADRTLSPELRFAAGTAAGTFRDAECLLNNSFSEGRSFRSYEAFFGASNCSSTGGGRDRSPFRLAETGPLSASAPQATGISISAAAAAGILDLSGDPLLLIGQAGRIGGSLQAIGEGISLR